MKISLKEAVTDFVGEVLNEVYRGEFRDREKIKDIIYSAMYRLSLEYMDRTDDVAMKGISLEVDRLIELNDNLVSDNRRLREMMEGRIANYSIEKEGV